MAFAQIEELPAAVPCSEPREKGSLLAVRLAGAPFSSPYDLRSPAFVELLAERSRLARVLSELSEDLLERIFQAIPKTSDRTARRRLIDVRRRIFNDRPLGTDPLDAPADLVTWIESYSDLKSRQEELLAARKAEVLAAIRRQLREIWDDPRFRLACRYASPSLVEDLERKGFPAVGEMTSAERGLYAFLSRWMSKANPFHLFAALAFPPSTGIPVDGEHEVVLNAADLLAHERRLLELVDDPDRVRLQLRTFQTHAQTLVFWIPAADGFHLAAVPAGTPFLRETIDFFTRGRKHGATAPSLANWRRAVAGPLGLEAAEEALRELCRQGIVQRFLITDLDNFLPSLIGIQSDQDGALARLQSLHLARLTTGELARAGAGAPRLDLDTRYYVNSYRRLETGDFERAAERLRPALTELKPYFSPSHNFSRNRYVLRAYCLDYLNNKGLDRVPYLEILRHFLRNYREVIARYQPETHLPAAELFRLQERRAQLSGLTGELGAVAFDPPGPAPPSLCFNGPFDFVEQRFYVTNVFAGEGRFVSRYLLHRRRETGAPEAAEDLDVELAVPPEPNLNYVVRRYSIGCGFETRYAHPFESWIDPAEILIERAPEGIAYRDSVSGRKLRLHYRGFQLASLLPTEYQLLLIGHADTYDNPFRSAPAGVVEEGGISHGISYDEGLRYGPVCLRRESWSLKREVWRDLLLERDSLRLAVRLRELVHARLRPEELWYYQANAGTLAKPRLLDLLNPLSALAFQHAASAVAEDEVLALSVMQPPPPHLYQHQGAPLVTELMIEV